VSGVGVFIWLRRIGVLGRKKQPQLGDAETASSTSGGTDGEAKKEVATIKVVEMNAVNDSGSETAQSVKTSEVGVTQPKQALKRWMFWKRRPRTVGV